MVSKRKAYVNVGLPIELIDQIDDIINKKKLGYKSRGEFAKEAVRNLLKQVK